jgi:recombination protein RecA
MSGKKIKTSTKKELTPADIAIQEAIKQMDKEFGKGTVQILGNDAPKMMIETFSTGSMLLDSALGTGGFPRGRIVEIYGPESSGKCLTGDTQVFTNAGLKTIKRIIQEHDIKDLTPELPCLFSSDISLINKNGDMEKVGGITYNGKKEVFQITTKSGNVIKCTANHPHLTINERGQWVWKKTQSISKGDFLMQPHSFSNPGNLKQQMTAMGDKHPDTIKIIRHIGQKASQDTRKFKREMENIGIKDNGIFTSQFDFISQTPVYIGFFLKGYFSELAETTTKGITINLHTLKMGMNVKLLLQSLGFGSVLNHKDKTLLIPGDQAIQLIETLELDHLDAGKIKESFEFTKIPNLKILMNDTMMASTLDSKEKQAFFDALWEFSWRNVELSHLQEFIKLDWEDCSAFRRLKEVYEASYFYDPVVSIIPAGKEETYDFTCPETHSFVANGLATHNTTIALHAIAEIQKSGGKALFIDAEHALDIKYAGKLGVNVDDLILSQPDYGEQALEVCERFVRTGAISLIVIDSVAALVPKAEIEGDMGASHVGLQARLMSQALRKLTGIAQSTKTTILFINQIRHKIGVMFGNPETTSGGNALKFYASIRLDIRRIGTVKDSVTGDMIYNRVRVKVVKNKLAPPFRECETEIHFGKGFSKENEYYIEALKYDVLKKSGSWLSWGEDRWQGKDNTVKFFEDNPKVFEKFMKEVKEAKANASK